MNMKTNKTKAIVRKARSTSLALGANRAEKPVLTDSMEPSLRVKKILVPVDFSGESKKALKYAQAFAHQFGAGIILLHVVEAVIYPGDLGYGSMVLPEVTETLQENGKTRLEMLAKEESASGLKIRTRVRMGSAFNEITLAAKEENVDLIVIATHGYTGLKHVFLGSTAERVVRYAPCPVLTVRVRGHELV
jgi:universal stress protein A